MSLVACLYGTHLAVDHIVWIINVFYRFIPVYISKMYFCKSRCNCLVVSCISVFVKKSFVLLIFTSYSIIRTVSKADTSPHFLLQSKKHLDVNKLLQSQLNCVQNYWKKNGGKFISYAVILSRSNLK